VNLLLLLGFAAVVGAPVEPGEVIDKGTFKVYQRDRALGTETFEFDSHGDSLSIFSHVVQVLPGPGGDLPIDKQVTIVLGSFDYDLRFYQSKTTVGGPDSLVTRRGVRDLTRSLVVSDTALTAYRESSSLGGWGDRLERPAGKFFVLDGQVFVLFDVMCRDLGAKPFQERAVSVILLRDEQDQVTSITAADLGTETIRWAARPVTARKLRFSDSYSTFNAWVGPQGVMLRLEQDGSGLLVERDPSAAQAVKRPAKPTPH
jgi:hypothetical protein